ncbi:MAG: HAD family phosphatase [Clostridia bacterium]|nr:HAD family phosphatase [Clostridia bacterium]MBQ7348327.1 HAD family phosphatase [Clostridia bacterium]
MAKEIKNIVFDQGKVLLDFTIEKVLTPVFPNKEDYQLAVKVVFTSKDWERVDAGTMTEMEALDRWLKNTPPHMHAGIHKMFETWYSTMTPVPGMTELVRTLKANGYRCYLLSNTAPRFYAFYPTVEAMRLMDGFIVSAVHRLAKPDPAIYHRLFETYDLDPEECFFVDDVAENIEAGRKLGMRGFQFVDFDVDGLKKALKDEGVNI